MGTPYVSMKGVRRDKDKSYVTVVKPYRKKIDDSVENNVMSRANPYELPNSDSMRII